MKERIRRWLMKRTDVCNVLEQNNTFVYPGNRWTTNERPRIYINLNSIYPRWRIRNTYKDMSPSNHWSLWIEIKPIGDFSIEFKRRVK